MARLRYANGSVVEVSDEKVETLLRSGFSTIEEPKKATRRKAKSSDEDTSK